MKKKNLMVGLIFVAAFLMVLPSSALSASYPPVSFYLIDNPNDPLPDGDNLVELDVFNYGVTSLDYSWDGSNWESYTGDGFDVDTTRLIYFRADESYTTGLMTFQALQTEQYYGLPAYRSLVIDWAGGASTELTFTTAKYKDFLAPAPVPIPATAWIFGAGLVGLIGVRRKLRT